MLIFLMLVVLAAESIGCRCVGCGEPPSLGLRADEKWFTTDDGWSFVAPANFERNTAPGTTGFAVFRPPPAKPLLNIVFTWEPFDGDTSAFVATERAKVTIVKETANGHGVVVEESWPIGPNESGMALVALSVVDGFGVRLACITDGAAFESQRPICERAIGSLLRRASH